MRQIAISFQFSDSKSALLAFDTLQELGYEPVLEDAEQTKLHIHIEDVDITSALEIAQAHGGTLLDHAEMTETACNDYAYRMDLIPIPAHVVNEDWADEYSNAASVYNQDVHNNLDLRNEDHRDWYDETTDHFSGEVKA